MKILLIFCLLTPFLSFAESYIDISGYDSNKTRTFSYDLKIDKRISESKYLYDITSSVFIKDSEKDEKHRVELSVEYTDNVLLYVSSEIDKNIYYNAVGVELIYSPWSQKVDVSEKAFSSSSEYVFENDDYYIKITLKYSSITYMSINNKIRYTLKDNVAITLSYDVDNDNNRILDFKLGYSF